MTVFVTGLIFGSIIGYMTCAIMVAGSDDDDKWN